VVRAVALDRDPGDLSTLEDEGAIEALRAGLAVVPKHVVHPGLLGGWGCRSHQHQGEDPDEDSR
jgi:hypothetical protein